MDTKDCEIVTFYQGEFIGHFGILSILQYINGIEFKGACDYLSKYHQIPVVDIKLRTPQRNGLIVQTY
jgi:hypothetical protein